MVEAWLFALAATNGSLGVALAATGLVYGLRRPRSLPQWLLAAHLVIVGCTVALFIPIAFFGGAWWESFIYIGWAINASLIAFIWVFPRPVRARSWHAPALLLIAVPSLVLLGALLANHPDPSTLVLAHGDNPGAHLTYSSIADNPNFAAWALVQLTAMAIAVVRLPTGAEGRAKLGIVAALASPAFFSLGRWLLDFALLPIATNQRDLAMYCLDDDPCSPDAALRWLVLPLGLACMAWLARKGSWLPTACVAAGTLVAVLPSDSNFSILQLGWAGTVYGLAHALQSGGAFGLRPLQGLARMALALGLALMGFVIVTGDFSFVYGDNPMAIALGVFAGMMFAGTTTWLAVLRPDWHASLPLLGASDNSLALYREALAGEIRTGASPADTLQRLQGMRSRLGITDADHRIMDYAMRPAANADPGRLAPGTDFLGRYQVERTLGSGGAGTTYLCRDLVLQRPVALKVLRPNTRAAREAAVREARAVAALQHPNVVTLHDVEELGDHAFLVMEHMPRGSLADRLATGPLDEAEWLAAGRDLLRGLQAAHGKGLVHRDVKPSNLLLAADGTVKVGDFGVATATADPDATRIEESIGPQAVGTVGYLSPEAARGRRVGPATDVYSAATVLFEAATGRPFLPRAGDASVVEGLMAAAAAPGYTGGLPAALRRFDPWMKKALAPDGAQRHGDAGAALADFDKRAAARGGGLPAPGGLKAAPMQARLRSPAATSLRR